MINRNEIFYNPKNKRAYKCRVLSNTYLGRYIPIAEAATELEISRQALQYHIKKGHVNIVKDHCGNVLCSLDDILNLQSELDEKAAKCTE